MKFALQLFFLSFLLLFLNCKKEASSDDKSTVEEPANNNSVIEHEIAEERPKDSINSKNVVQFLTLYGNENKQNRVLIKTRLGNIKIQLYNDTPLHRASFIFLTKMGYFDTTCFYRVVPDFVIQGGESERLDTQRYKARYERYKIKPEFRENRKHKYGAVALARDWKDNPGKKSTAFEFYIVQNRKGAHHLDGEHTVFGEVITGFETIDKIVNLEAGNDEWPLHDVFMKIEVIN
ncbi:peptidylprolyl isomerase [Lutimonas halocynthiae]|uniref:peptidylprolyl isomerase n=1 Tax=Lutimonas halocynthiae TaxID=1446477 RepID=UPI0025B42E34|nr:peptidylprolyl isomerase [Lutimonas halocynthiae]MDN3644214.1 peptidylprolyl isomerase [Lutimonas halocynthiae]